MDQHDPVQGPFRARPFWMRRQGRACVLPLDPVLPNVCVKCGSIEVFVRRRKTYEQARLSDLVVPRFVGERAKPRKATVDLPLCARCDAWQRIARNLIMAGWGSVVVVALVCRWAPMLVTQSNRAAIDDAIGDLAIAWFVAIPLVGLLHIFLEGRAMLPGLVRIDDETIVLAHFGRAAMDRLEALAQGQPPKDTRRMHRREP